LQEIKTRIFCLILIVGVNIGQPFKYHTLFPLRMLSGNTSSLAGKTTPQRIIKIHLSTLCNFNVGGSGGKSWLRDKGPSQQGCTVGLHRGSSRQ
jgi:hypothetical protein